MKRYTIHEAKTHFSKLIQQALRGEEVIIANRDKPILRLVPVKEPDIKNLFGLFKGQIRMAPDFKDTPEGFEEYK